MPTTHERQVETTLWQQCPALWEEGDATTGKVVVITHYDGSRPRAVKSAEPNGTRHALVKLVPGRYVIEATLQNNQLAEASIFKVEGLRTVNLGLTSVVAYAQLQRTHHFTEGKWDIYPAGKFDQVLTLADQKWRADDGQAFCYARQPKKKACAQPPRPQKTPKPAPEPPVRKATLRRIERVKTASAALEFLGLPPVTLAKHTFAFNGEDRPYAAEYEVVALEKHVLLQRHLQNPVYQQFIALQPRCQALGLRLQCDDNKVRLMSGIKTLFGSKYTEQGVEGLSILLACLEKERKREEAVEAARQAGLPQNILLGPPRLEAGRYWQTWVISPDGYNRSADAKNRKGQGLCRQALLGDLVLGWCLADVTGAEHGFRILYQSPESPTSAQREKVVYILQGLQRWTDTQTGKNYPPVGSGWVFQPAA